MKSISIRTLCVVSILTILGSCKKDGALKGEVWPKTGYLITTNYDQDTVFVEGGNFAETSPYNPRYPIDDTEKRWTISLPSSGDGVLIHNSRGEYWSIDSVFMPGANVEQFYITFRSTNDPSKLTERSRFKYHKAGNGNSFYIQSVYYPKLYVTGLPHARSGRGLRLVPQDNGNWEFWFVTQ